MSAGDMCEADNLSILSSEEVCTSTFHDFATMLKTPTVLPAANCLDSHLLLCSDFLWPLSFWLASLAIMMVLSVACLLYLAMAMPREIKGTFESLAYLMVEEFAERKESFQCE